MKRVIVTRPYLGLVAMQVCAASDATDEEILAACNTENPAGTRGGWMDVSRDGSRDAALAPVACDKHPGRVHFVVLC